MGLRHRIVLLVLVVALTVSASGMEKAHASVQYRINREWVTVWINEDASIELHYNITITYESVAEGYLTIGLPARDFRIVSVQDLSGNDLDFEDISGGGYYAVEAYLGHPMNPGDNGTVLLIATVPNVVFPDETNPGNVGMKFKPTYFDDAVTEDLRVAIVPPDGVPEDDIKTSEPAFFTTVDGAFAVYWEESDLPPGTQRTFGVSFPEEYVTLPSKGLDVWFYLAIFSLAATIVVVVVLLMRRRKEAYERPRIKIEALGPARSLTAVEAAVLLGLEPIKVLTMILFGLLLKGFVVVKETEPLIKVERLPSDASAPHPRYYEIDFLDAVEPDGSLNEPRLARTYVYLREAVDKKMQGYARVDTINYYRSVVNKAWSQVKQANTPQLAEEAIEKNLDWLLLDGKYKERFKEDLSPNIVILPQPHWYWYLPRIPPGERAPTSTEVKPVPAQEFADRVVTGIEKAAGGLVKNVEDFTRRLIPPKVTIQSSKPVRSRSSCVCACASCACACACVSCACACAGGGAR